MTGLCPSWVKGSCDRQADGTAGLPPLPDSCSAANCASFDHLVERAALMRRVTLHGLDQVGDQVVVSSLGIPVAADSCDATLAASLNVELPMNVKLPKGIACRAPDFNRTYTP